MDVNDSKIVELQILIIGGKKETEVTLGIGVPENACCYAFIDGFEKPRRKTGLGNWDAFLRAVAYLSVRLQELERQGYKFAILDSDPPREATVLDLMAGITYVRSMS